MAVNEGLGDKISAQIIRGLFLPSYYLTLGLLAPVRKTFREKGLRLGRFEIPNGFAGILNCLCLLMIFNLWIIIALAIFQPFQKPPAWETHWLPGLAHGLVVLQYKLSMFFDFGVWHSWIPLFVWWFIFLPAPLCLAHILLVKPRKHPLQRSLDRYKSDRPGPELNMKAVHAEAVETAKREGYDFTLLGYDYKYKRPAIITDQERLRHVQIIGGTGSGKTSSLILPMMIQDMRRGRAVVFVDAKGDLNTAKTVYKMALNAGREKDFLIFSMGFPEKSNTYNPLALGNATQLKDKIIGSMEFTEPHFKRECEFGLQILFAEMQKHKDKITLNTVSEILMNPPAKYTKFLSFYGGHKKNISGIQNEIGLIANTEFSYLFEGDEINLMRAYRDNKIVYFALDTLSEGDTGKRLGHLITGDINTLCGMIQKSEIRSEIAIYIDEYGTFGTPPFAITLAQGRSAGFMVTISHQSNADLRQISPEHAEAVKANTNTRIVLKASTQDAEDFCNETGTYRDIEVTRQVAIAGQINGTEMGSEKVIDVYHINPQELRQLTIGQAGYKTPSRQGLVQLTHCGYSDDVLKSISFPDRATQPDSMPPDVQGPQKNIINPQPENMFDA
jgi:hypothetical protein